MNTKRKASCVVTLNPDTLDALVEMYADIHPESEPLKIGTDRFEIFVNDIVDLCKMKEDHITRLKERVAFLESSLDYTRGVLQNQGQTHANIDYVKTREIMDLKMRVATLESEIRKLKYGKVDS